jgi:hypothetical protein
MSRELMSSGRGFLKKIRVRKIDDTIERQCSKCLIWKSVEHFSFLLKPIAPEIKPKYRNYCKSCDTINKRESRKNQKTKESGSVTYD